MDNVYLVEEVYGAQQIVDDCDDVVLLYKIRRHICEKLRKVKSKAFLDYKDIIKLQIAIFILSKRHDTNIVQFDGENVMLYS